MIATSFQWLPRHDDVSILLRQLRHWPDNEMSRARGPARCRCVFHLRFSGGNRVSAPHRPTRGTMRRVIGPSRRQAFEPSIMSCDPIPYALETDWLAGAAGFEPLHLEIRSAELHPA